MDEMSRQGILLWLKSLVENGTCSGVSWIDREKGIFKIPWSNQKSRSWQKEDSAVFLEYAKHTGKYKADENMDFPKWKQNLKSAINKSRFIERLRNMDRLCGPKPYRVYQFLNEISAYKRKSNNKSSFVAKNLVVSDKDQEHQSSIMEINKVFVIENVCHTGRSISTNSSSMLHSESESSSLSTLYFSDCNMPLSPDIPRSDLFDQVQGNIPVFIEGICGENNAITVGETAPVPESLTRANHITDGSIHLSIVQEEIQGVQAVDNISVEVPDMLMQTLEMTNHNLTVTQPQQAMTIPANVVTSYSVAVPHSEKYFMLSQVISSSMLEQPNTQAPGSIMIANKGCLTHENVAHSQAMVSPTSVQKSELSSKVHMSTNSLPPCLEDKHLHDRPVQLAEQGVEYVLSCNNIYNTHSVDSTQSTSFPELFTGCGIDAPFSMDTSEESIQSEGKGKFTGFRFATFRDNNKHMSSIPHDLLNIQREPDDSVMHVQVLYGTPHRTVKKFKVESSRCSCRLFYGSVNCTTMQNAMQGQQDADEVELPSVDKLNYNEKTKNTIRKILQDMELGIVISYRDGDIYVERRCLPRVYLSDGVSRSESLPRSTVKRPDIETKAFDFNKSFKKSLELNQINKGPVPKDHFFLTVGYEILPNDDSPTRLVPLYIVVRHVQAASMRFKILGDSTTAPNPMCSDPNSFDKIVGLFKEIDLKKPS